MLRRRRRASLEAVGVETEKQKDYNVSSFSVVGVHLKKDEDCAFGSWTMLLLTTLPRVLPGADGVPAFWGNNDEMEKRENTKEPRSGKKLDRSFGVAR